MPPSVLIVGSFNQDLTWNTPRFPAPGETTVGSFTTGPGGKGSNQAVACARTGVATAFVGAIGDDTFGRALPDFYDAENIRHHLAVKPSHPTGNAGIWVNAAGQNEIIVALGSNLALEPADLSADLLDKAGVVVCQHEISPEMTAWTLREAARRQKITILNPAPMIPDFDSNLLAHVSILVPNETEFVDLVGQLGHAGDPALSEDGLPQLEDDSLQALCRKFGVATVIVTLGARGCFVSTAAEGRPIQAVQGIKAIDTTGAGDAFVGGLAAGLVEFAGDLFEAARYANTVAALSVTRPGTAPSMPRRKEIEAVFHRQ